MSKLSEKIKSIETLSADKNYANVVNRAAKLKIDDEIVINSIDGFLPEMAEIGGKKIYYLSVLCTVNGTETGVSTGTFSRSAAFAGQTVKELQKTLSNKKLTVEGIEEYLDFSYDEKGKKSEEKTELRTRCIFNVSDIEAEVAE